MANTEAIEYEWVEYAQFRCVECGQTWHISGSEDDLREQEAAAEAHVKESHNE